MDDAAAADGAGSAGNQSVRIEGDVFAGIVFNRLADGKQVIFVKRNFSDEFQALLIVPFQNDRRLSVSSRPLTVQRVWASGSRTAGSAASQPNSA